MEWKRDAPGGPSQWDPSGPLGSHWDHPMMGPRDGGVPFPFHHGTPTSTPTVGGSDFLSSEERKVATAAAACGTLRVADVVGGIDSRDDRRCLQLGQHLQNFRSVTGDIVPKCYPILRTGMRDTF